MASPALQTMGGLVCPRLRLVSSFKAASEKHLPAILNQMYIVWKKYPIKLL